MRRSACVAAILCSATGMAEDVRIDAGGHGKLNAAANWYPEESLFRDLDGASSSGFEGELRLTADLRRRGWSFDADYQVIGQHRTSSSIVPTGFPGAISAGPDDRRRWFDLTSVIDESTEGLLLHRMDRLAVGWTGERTVVKFGRQALSWGNGLFYTPMDLVNPFDPATIDTEYKAGDDMLYLQILRGNGDDVQAAAVVRRDPSGGDVESKQSTVALKYHGFAYDYEYDVLVAESYDETVIGLGASRALGGAAWSADIVLTDTVDDTFLQFVTNLSYSWIAFDRNLTGIVEYYFDGAGLDGGPYGPAALAANPVLMSRLQRGQSFSLGRHYLAGNIAVEVTPLWNLSTTLLASLADPSALAQITARVSVSDNLVALGTVSVPVGPDGSEFGGIDTGIPGRYLSSSLAVFAQIAWYF